MKPVRTLTLIVFFAIPVGLSAQSTDASLTGVVDDPSRAVVPEVSITAINTQTGITSSTKTNGTGQYVLTGLIPGTYRIEVDKQGFRGIIEAGLVLHVQDVVQINFHMAIGSMSETVTVHADKQNINTTDASVSTVVDQQFLQEIPLDGRTIQTLLMLTPGVQFTEGGVANSQGQFSSNGMRTDSNYFTIDGVAANISTDTVGNGLSEAAAGSAPGFNALGGTNGLVSVDAIQEFRVQTSSFAPEFGRTPGAQVGVLTRSGSNAWNGSLFDYLRNDAFDANDWFGDHNGIAKARERQNDFGGVLGGPIVKDHTFGFFSYEGMRLVLPSELEAAVPDAAARRQLSSRFSTPMGA